MLCNNEKLAKTSGSPGKTQLLNHFLISSAPSAKANQTAAKPGDTRSPVDPAHPWSRVRPHGREP
jgi:hypothetical protein